MKLKKILKILCRCGIMFIAYLIGRDIGGILVAMICSIISGIAADIVFDCMEVILS